MSFKLHKIIAAIIISTAILLAASSVWDENIIVDEVPHIGAGYSYLVKKDMRLNPEHPPLAKDIAAIPLLFLDLKQDVFDTQYWQSDINGQWYFGRILIFQSDNDTETLTRAVKMPMLIFFVLSVVLIFKWAGKLYGKKAALIATFIFAFSPTVITHTRFVTTDVPAMFGILLASYFFIKWIENHSQKNMIIAGLAFGVAILTKFSTFLLIPYFLILAVIYGLTRKEKIILNVLNFTFKSLLIIIVGFILIVWPVYYFHTYNYPVERQVADTEYLLGSFGRRNLAEIIVWMADKPVIRAMGQYGLGLLMVVQRSVGGNTTYFMGEVSKNSWPHYFPIVYFLKEPLAWWILVFISLFYLAWQVKQPQEKNRDNPAGVLARLKNWLKNHFTEFAMLLWLAIYWYTSVTGNLNIGVRHLLPIYPFTIILVSGQISKIIQKLKGKSQNSGVSLRSTNYKLIASYLLITVLLGWYFIENLRIYPHYLSYFNQVAGGSSGGYRYVVDSNLDWGQDLSRLARWVKEQNIPAIEFDYFGWADPSYYLGPAYIWSNSTKFNGEEDFKQRNMSDGWLAVSATFLQGSEGPKEEGFKEPNYYWLKRHKPVTIIGNSIFVYRIR